MRPPSETVDAFHAALRAKNTAGALSLLDRGLVVFEFGPVDPTVEAYAFQHLPLDMDIAVALEPPDPASRQRRQRTLGALHLPCDRRPGRRHADRPDHA